jgi:hypothetical protein
MAQDNKKTLNKSHAIMPFEAMPPGVGATFKGLFAW